jgi:hypothetical protein
MIKHTILGNCFKITAALKHTINCQNHAINCLGFLVGCILCTYKEAESHSESLSDSYYFFIKTPKKINMVERKERDWVG